MSFSSNLKNEILENRRFRGRYKNAHAYGLFMFAKGFSLSSVSISTEQPETAKLFTRFLQDFLGRSVAVTYGEKTKSGRPLYTVRLDRHADRERILAHFGQKADGSGVNMDILPSAEHVHAFLSGAYLACGNITDPSKGYHIEYVVRDERLCEELANLLNSCLPGAKRAVRRTNYIVYYKEYSQIEDLLTLMGASKSCLAMIDVEMMKNVRNNANRATNCETANIDKLVDAAAAQIEDIGLVLERVGAGNLPESLIAAANLRLENPDSSLRELAELSGHKISRSGIYHRLAKLSRLADEIRAEEAES